ncbi:YokU family protein [Calidifontibacillus erzurumensis]|uniref:YokU family protein n=1 Tax=Calidifontibacillus erzurumensis TaxID=2741433 RepID=A0A8J8KCX0_9BACI|nr:YokU family protein [Calidifontibacillus erzurumensis]NSL52418.1 YokU family protein [Calidifontibacillus erzurumensis]
MQCDWCQETNAIETTSTVYWELPDGSKAIEITETPSIKCPSCNMVYQMERTVEAIEDQLLLIDTKQLGKTISYDALMKIPRLLKRNYFRF